MRHMNNIAGTLQEELQRDEPLVMATPNDSDPVPVIDEWCTGFMRLCQLSFRSPVVSRRRRRAHLSHPPTQ